jgi:hypothetical protein
LIPELPREIVGTERVGQQLAKGSRAAGMVDQHLWATMLQKHLPATAARHEQGARPVDTRERDQPAAAPGMQGTDHSALGTETQAI